MPELTLHGLTALVAAPFLGSFLGVLVKRLPVGEPVAFARSKCPHCATVLGVRDLVPVLSWVAARGHCRYCGANLGAFYPTVETAAVAIAIWSILTVPGWLVWPTCVLGWMLLALALIDAATFLLPNKLTLPLVAAGLATAWLIQPASVVWHAAAAVAAFLFFEAAALAYRRLRGREGLGRGDAKLLAAAGAWVSLPGLPSVVLLAALTALAWAVWQRRRSGVSTATPMPFGPFLALGTWLVWLYGPIHLGTPW